MRLLLAALLVGCAGNPPPSAAEEPAPADASVPDATPPTPPVTTATLLEARLAAATVPGPDGAQLVALPALRRFYAARDYAPIWTDIDGRPRDRRLDQLRDTLAMADQHGLVTAHYHGDGIRRGRLSVAVAAGAVPLERAVDLELLASDAFLALGGHLRAGLFDPATLEEDWRAVRRESNMPAILETAVASGDIAAALRELPPRDASYQRLLDAYARYRALAASGPFPELGPRPSKDELGNRLAAEGFDDLRDYQRARGLPASGRLDAATHASLAISPAERERTVRANLERWRWMPSDLGDRHIIVDIPGFELVARDGAAEIARVRIIVGKTYRKTPVFSGAMTKIVVNPTWTVPKTILTEDKLPEIRKDPGFLTKNHFEVIDRDDKVVAPTTVDWSAFDPAKTRYRLRMTPGAHNPLGRIKFDIVNEFAVYLHDTDDRSLFRKGVRTFSSGCIRVQRPEDLAAWALDGAQGWDKAALEKAITAGTTVRVPIRRPITVHLTYFTAHVDDRGRTVFVDDVYGRDPRLIAAFEAAEATKPDQPR